ncbi:hypothetical protein NDU88_004391 [Pleurodeles waltl]|uniref:Uncharacterized protein n=1 Tax=Pleurodeles waltl TaxID=8319 RepID=A0AAV7UGZ4_PLEWA|nr:hypothetical protein NDU88_004391 [Pleurodeles waltl]
MPHLDERSEELCRTLSASGRLHRRLGLGERRTAGPEVRPHDWTGPLVLALAAAGAPEKTLRGPAGLRLYPGLRTGEDPGLPCP